MEVAGEEDAFMEVEIGDNFSTEEEGPLRADFEVVEELGEEFIFWEAEVEQSDGDGPCHDGGESKGNSGDVLACGVQGGLKECVGEGV
jgi:hypothetical protein